MFVCSFVLRLVDHGVPFEGHEARSLFVSLSIPRSRYTIHSVSPSLHQIPHDCGISGCFRKLRTHARAIAVEIKLRDVSFSSSKSTFVRLMWLTARMPLWLYDCRELKGNDRLKKSMKEKPTQRRIQAS